MTQGGFPQKISRYLQDFFDGMSSANYQHIAGGCDGKHYYCSIGDVTIDGQTISNCVIRYSIHSQEWAVLSYPTMPRVFTTYISTNDVLLIYGDNDGNVIQIDSTAVTDAYALATPAIDYELHTRIIFEPIRGSLKTIGEKAYVNSEASSGARFYVRADKHDNRHEDWRHLAELTEDCQTVALPTIDYRTIRFKVAGVSTKGRFSLKSIEFPNNTINHY
jgi:hypothetical protein